MPPNIPPSRPGWARERVLAAIALHSGSLLPGDKVAVLGVRGYYRDTMGKPGANDRGIYDDAIFLVDLPEGQIRAYNANTDPSVFRSGIATLAPGVHRYRPGNHGISRPGGGYPAFRPATRDEALPVLRDGIPGTSDGIAINIHRGSYNSTSSAGCQTIHPDQWSEFQKSTMKLLAKYAQKTFPYILIAQQG